MLGFGTPKDRATRTGEAVDTLVGPEVVLRGELRFAGGLYLEGCLLGSVLALEGRPAQFTIAARGRVEGEVRAPVVVVHGCVVGDIHAGERLELGPGARVEGRLHYNVLQIAAGAAVSGQLQHCGPAPAGPAQAPATPAPSDEAAPTA